MKKLFLLLIVSAMIIGSCDNATTPARVSKENMNNQKPGTNNLSVDKKIKSAKVLEAIDAGTYTYVRLEFDKKEFWAAITAMPVDTGKTYYYKESILMRDFHSKQLQKTFDSILFIESFFDHEHMGMDVTKKSSPRDHTATVEEENLTIGHSGDELPLSDLFSDKEKYQGKQVTVKGKVVKISSNIMDRNWIHIQDGSNYNGEFDLTITLFGTVDFALNDIVAFKGNITLNKDFGAGYVYNIIMEDAEVVK